MSTKVRSSTKLVLLSATATLMAGTALADAPSVAVDIAPVHSLVARVMDGVGTPNLIVQPGASPHEYSMRPSEAAALQDADLVFWMGEDLAPWLENALDTLSTDASVTALLEADNTTLLDFRENALFEAHSHDDHDDHDDHGHSDEEHGHDDHGHGHDEHAHEDDHGHDEHEDHAHDDDHGHDEHEDHAHDDDHGHDEHEDHAHDDDHGHDEHEGHDDHSGHDHGEHDPHAWLSPTNAATWLNVIAAQLSAADPDNAGTYFANAAAGSAELEALMAEVNAILEPARGTSFIVFHDAYQYFEVDFDFPASGAISLGDAADPSPARIAEIQARVRDEGVDCVLAEPQFNPGLVETVLDGTDASTGVIDPLGSTLEPGPALYPQLIRNLATTLAECV
ncbi:MAG: zinc ABC transporter substrate-binding protein [Pseudomonadota bacterium]